MSKGGSLTIDVSKVGMTTWKRCRDRGCGEEVEGSRVYNKEEYKYIERKERYLTGCCRQ